METHILQAWDFVSLKETIKTEQGIVPKGTRGRLIEFYGKELCKVMLSFPRCHMAVISPHVLERICSHVEFTRFALFDTRVKISGCTTRAI